MAAGRLDGFWEQGLKPWDMAAGIVLVREAGGMVGDMAGRGDPMNTGNIVAGNLLNTGAFEVTYDGQPVWSKLETGRFPQMDELMASLSGVLEASAAQLAQ